MGVDRNLLLVLFISIVSTIAGITFYSLAFDQPEFISANKLNEASNQSSTKSLKSVNTGFKDLVLNDLNGKPHYLNDWKKPVLIINFWAPWCPPCRREIPALNTVQQIYHDNVQLLGLSFDAEQNVVNFLSATSINYPLLLVQKEATQINSYFGNNSGGLPYTVILNQQREIIFQHNGEINQEILEARIKELL